MKTRIALIFCAVGATAATRAAFFDGFDGSSLGSHWDFFSEGSNWTHSVSGGHLSVTALGGPHEFYEVGIVATVGSFTDFAAEVAVMWDAGTHQTFSFGLSEFFPFMNPRIGTMRYSVSPTASATVSAALSGGGNGSTGAPGSGTFHVFRMERTGSHVSAWLNGSLLAETNSGAAERADQVFLHFGGPETSAFGEFQVDYVSVVPEPSVIAAFAAGALGLLRRKGRKKAASP
jgi:hypothetical protein